MDLFDLIVLGAGPVGENVADRARAAGLSVALVESELAGGECSYWACAPSKALLRPAAALTAARRVEGASAAVSGELDPEAVLARRDSFAEHWDDTSQVEWIDSTGTEYFRGKGRLDGPYRVIVQTTEGVELILTARHAVAVCTGTRAALPPLPGLERTRPWTNREGTAARRVPDRLAVVGGGPVGVELATVWHTLGARVTLLARSGGLLPRMEPFAGEAVREELVASGVEVRTDTSVTEVHRTEPSGEVHLTTTSGSEDSSGSEETVVVDEVLFATGRTPRTSEIGLETVGLIPGDWLEVDDTLQVSGVRGGWLYAVGDVNHRALLTHQGKYQARVAAAAIVARVHGVSTLETGRWGTHSATADHDAVPQVVFGIPEVASVGLTTREAERRGIRATPVDFDLGAVAGAALFADGYEGRARMVVDEDRKVVVGVTFVGAGVSELLHSASVAVVGEVPLERLWHAVPAFPTMSEVWLRLLETYRG